jgi:hypothetical protein
VQVNHSPSLATDTPLDLAVKSQLVRWAAWQQEQQAQSISPVIDADMLPDALGVIDVCCHDWSVEPGL